MVLDFLDCTLGVVLVIDFLYDSTVGVVEPGFLDPTLDVVLLESTFGDGFLAVNDLLELLVELFLLTEEQFLTSLLDLLSTSRFSLSPSILLSILLPSVGDSAKSSSWFLIFLGELSGVSLTRKVSGFSLEVSNNNPDDGLSTVSPGE